MKSVLYVLLVFVLSWVGGYIGQGCFERFKLLRSLGEFPAYLLTVLLVFVLAIVLYGVLFL